MVSHVRLGHTMPYTVRNAQRHHTFVLKDYEKIAQIVKQHYSIVLELRETSTKGWNWGTTDIQGGSLPMSVDYFGINLPNRIFQGET
jgi:hypothetical protein